MCFFSVDVTSFHTLSIKEKVFDRDEILKEETVGALYGDKV